MAPPRILPPVMLPVAEINPGVVTLPPAMFPVTLSALTTFELRLNPPAFKLPPVMLPVALINPVTYSPVVSHTTTFDVPATPTVMLALLNTVTFEVPLAMFDPPPPPAIPVSNEPLPMK